jgi:hypothetical protein
MRFLLINICIVFLRLLSKGCTVLFILIITNYIIRFSIYLLFYLLEIPFASLIRISEALLYFRCSYIGGKLRYFCVRPVGPDNAYRHSLDRCIWQVNKYIVHRNLCRVFQKELYNFESLYEFIQRTCTLFRTIIM